MPCDGEVVRGGARFVLRAPGQACARHIESAAVCALAARSLGLGASVAAETEAAVFGCYLRHGAVLTFNADATHAGAYPSGRRRRHRLLCYRGGPPRPACAAAADCAAGEACRDGLCGPLIDVRHAGGAAAELVPLAALPGQAVFGGAWPLAGAPWTFSDLGGLDAACVYVRGDLQARHVPGSRALYTVVAPGDAVVYVDLPLAEAGWAGFAEWRSGWQRAPLRGAALEQAPQPRTQPPPSIGGPAIGGQDGASAVGGGATLEPWTRGGRTESPGREAVHPWSPWGQDGAPVDRGGALFQHAGGRVDLGGPKPSGQPRTPMPSRPARAPETPPGRARAAPRAARRRRLGPREPARREGARSPRPAALRGARSAWGGSAGPGAPKG